VSEIDRIETERLVCERVRAEDADELAQLMLHPDVVRTTWLDVDPPTHADVVEKVVGNARHWQRHGFGPWMLRDRATGKLVGRAGLQHTMTTGVDEVEVGWAIMPDRWGEGLATEVARTSVDVAFGPLGLDEVIAFTAPDNIASWRVMEKAGFVHEGEFAHFGLPHVLYRSRRLPGSATRREID
jgi:RimJ/RimL family protein N-acetyltransferase